MQDSSALGTGPGQEIATAELAGLAASTVWALSSLLFAHASRRLGPFRANGLRILLASLVLAAVQGLWLGGLWPGGLGSRHLWLLLGSGLCGLALGDWLYFHSISVLGARIGSLLMATAPMQAALLAWMVLDERPELRALGGIAAVCLGVVVVVLERRPPPAWSSPPGQRRLAVVTGLCGGLGQAGGLVLARSALVLPTADGTLLPPLTATYLRMLAALAFVLPWSLVAMRARSAPPGPKRRPVALLALGVLLGPTTGVWLSMVAVRGQQTGVAAALLALAPILVIPVAWLVHGERPGLLGLCGTLVATGGTFLLVWG